MIQGTEREVKEFKNYVGVGEFHVVGFNLTSDQIKKQLGYEPKQEMNYLKKSQEGNDAVTLTVFLKHKETGVNQRATYYIEDKVRTAQDGKTQYVNNRAMSSYVQEAWFTKNDYRPAFVGEAEFFNFLKNWLSNFDWFSDDSDTKLDLTLTKDIIKGNVKVLNDLASKYSKQTIGHLIGIRSYDGKEYQDVYTKACLPGYAVAKMQGLPKGLPAPEIEKQSYAVKQFLKQVEGQYGYQNFFGNSYKFREYDPKENQLTGGSGLISSATPVTSITY